MDLNLTRQVFNRSKGLNTRCFTFYHDVSCVNDYVVPLCMHSKVGYTWQILVSYTHPTCVFKFFVKVQYSITRVLEGISNIDRN